MIKRIIITSGPTIEPIDPVRYISNRSSGKSGFHLAGEAVKRKIPEIIFITGPTCFIPSGEGVSVLKIETTQQMREQLKRYCSDADVIIMAAAVSDYRVASYSDKKIKKGMEQLTIHLIKNPDLLYELGQQKTQKQFLVGYAAETHDALENAGKKFQRKNLDLLILNEVNDENPAFDVDQNQVYFITSSGARKLDQMEKSSLASHIFDEIYLSIENKE
jgi:phosphopantothenoylcysteine decarboxylase / phosphopantothenate---cysteine ligase